MTDQHFDSKSGSPTPGAVDAEQFGKPHQPVNPFSDKPAMQWNPRRVLYTVFTCALTGGLAILIWTKLRLVTGVPRTAYADPAAEKPKTQGKQSPERYNERRDASVDELGGP
jgi:hypothetical protein